MFDVAGWRADSFVADLGTTVGDALLAPHRSYLPVVRPLLQHSWIKGMAHITGGGITENLPRILPAGCAAAIEKTAWRPPPIFRVLQERGRITEAEMFRAFNMGIGLIIACEAADADRVVGGLASAGESACSRIGTVVDGDRTVRYL